MKLMPLRPFERANQQVYTIYIYISSGRMVSILIVSLTSWPALLHKFLPKLFCNLWGASWDYHGTLRDPPEGIFMQHRWPIVRPHEALWCLMGHPFVHRRVRTEPHGYQWVTYTTPPGDSMRPHGRPYMVPRCILTNPHGAPLKTP